MIDQGRLIELLVYDASTGIFRWRELTGRKKAGARGKVLPSGYMVIILDGVTYYLHRLAWLCVHGNHPVFEIDHINGIRSDNRISNLRDVTRTTNLRNTRKARGESGLLGASRCRSKFKAEIRIEGRKTHIGVYDTAEEAHKAFIKARLAVDPTSAVI